VLSIRPASKEDVALVFEMIHELAVFEQSLHELTNTPGDLLEDGFGPKPKFRALIADWEGKPAGYALFCDCYSTWRGRQLYLEDLYVRPQFRGKGIGTALMARVAKLATDERCRAVGWEVLDWNKPAIDLYTSLGATFLDEYRIALVKGNALRELAGKDRGDSNT
jgi:GNAT superfamily N-acetyltransferase